MDRTERSPRVRRARSDSGPLTVMRQRNCNGLRFPRAAARRDAAPGGARNVRGRETVNRSLLEHWRLLALLTDGVSAAAPAAAIRQIARRTRRRTLPRAGGDAQASPRASCHLVAPCLLPSTFSRWQRLAQGPSAGASLTACRTTIQFSRTTKLTPNRRDRATPNSSSINRTARSRNCANPSIHGCERQCRPG